MAKILVVDDEPTILEVIRLRLLAVGHEVDIADDGDIGMERALSTQPDVLLLDMAMPTMSGYDAAKVLRQQGYKGVIIAVTSSSQVTDIKKSFAAGCDFLIPKPIDEKFDDRIALVLEKRGIG